MLTLALPDAKHVGATTVTTGTVGVNNSSSIVNATDDADSQLSGDALVAIAVYACAKLKSNISPLPLTTGPDGVKVYVTPPS